MQVSRRCRSVLFALCMAAQHPLLSVAVTRYVDADSDNPKPPYTKVSNAAVTIQEAIDVAVANDVILVANGVYDSGGRIVYGATMNRVAIDREITVRSVNGPAVTVIKGMGPLGDGAVRCAYVASNAVLSGFTLTNGFTRVSGDPVAEKSGGGAWCSSDGVLSNCVIVGNAADSKGGGSYGGTLYNCFFSSNTSHEEGGGAYGGTLYNCTLTDNTADDEGGGVWGATLYNSILWDNSAPSGPNWYSSTLSYCCTTPLPGGTGNIDDVPLFESAGRLFAFSPCVGKGSAAYASGVDIDGEVWSDPPSMGCDEYWPGTATGALIVAIEAEQMVFSKKFPVDFTAAIEGRASGIEWDWGDGTTTSNQPYASHSWSAVGSYSVTLTVFNESSPEGVTATATVSVVAMQYVSPSGSHVPPFISWATAATDIQAAVDAPVPGVDLILVTNGVYDTGQTEGFPVGGRLPCRVAVHRPITLRSVNGPASTWIKGHPGLGNDAVRCVYLTDGAILEGFTISEGGTFSGGGGGDTYGDGAGVFCDTTNAFITNCVVRDNWAYVRGGGVYRGTLHDCDLIANKASLDGGGSYESLLYSCRIISNRTVYVSWHESEGGGACRGVLTDCLLQYNYSGHNGGGSASASLVDCELIDNVAKSYGGGAYGGDLKHCYLIENSARHGGGAYESLLSNCLVRNNSAGISGGGAYGGALSNCTVVANSGYGIFDTLARNSIIYDNAVVNHTVSTMDYCCTSPLPTDGVGNIDSPPDFIDAANGLYKPRSDSSCVDAGGNMYASGPTDLLGARRIVNGVVDIGAYEYAPTNLVELVILGEPERHGAPSPQPYGTNFVEVSSWTESANSPADSNSGVRYWCKGWTGTGDVPDQGAGDEVTFVITRDSSITWHWGQEFFLDTAVEGIGSLSVDDGWYTNGSTVTVTAQAGLGSRFVEWRGGITGTNSSMELVMDMPHAVTARFERTAYSLDVVSPYGDPSPTAGVHWSSPGNTVEVSVAGSPVVGISTRSTCTGWQGSGSIPATGATTSTSFVALSDSTITWLWKTDFWLELRAEAGGAVSTDSCWVAADTDIVLSAEPMPGYDFAAWTGDLYSIENPLVLNMVLPTQLTATFWLKSHYVAADGQHLAPYTSWATAATNIQDAVDVARDGDVVFVTNGVYDTGGRAVAGSMTNRVTIDRPVTVRSVNGPDVTIIKGNGPLGDAAVRCAYVGTGATLAGFTLTNGFTRTSGDLVAEQSGGGVWCEPGAVLSNCVIVGNCSTGDGGGAFKGSLVDCSLTGNQAGDDGGGAYRGSLSNCELRNNIAVNRGGGANECTLQNSTMIRNRAFDGGGAHGGELINCFVYDNVATDDGGWVDEATGLKNCTIAYNVATDEGGGVRDSAISNSIVWYNAAALGNNYYESSLSFSCSTPLPAGTGNISAVPLFVDAVHLSSNSPCIGQASAAYSQGPDIDGEAWGDPPSMGCDEYHAGLATGDLSVAIEPEYVTFPQGRDVEFRGLIEGPASGNWWDWGDGTSESNHPQSSHMWPSTGSYEVTFSAFNGTYPAGVSATVVVEVTAALIHYVNSSNASPSAPYASWSTAATNIQDAVDAAGAVGATVLVTNGVYDIGGRAVFGTMTNRLSIDRPITVCSVNGPNVTFIKGDGPLGNAAVRCAYVGTNAVLCGFTLTNGYTRKTGDFAAEQGGGGV